jgi:hypothetical protein
MEAVVFYPESKGQYDQLISFADQLKIDKIILSDEEKKRLAGILLANLASKNPFANATMEEINSVVEEVRSEYFYGKKNNNS